MSKKKREMFNSEQKNRYISYCLLVANTDAEDAYRKFLVNFFERLGVFEEKYEQDFADLSFESMNKLLNELINGAIGYQKNILSQLTQYVSWAIENRKSKLTTNPLLGLKIEDLKLNISYTKTMLSSMDDLIQCLNKVLAPLEDDSIDNQYRAFCMLLFEGLSTDEIIDLKEVQIDFSNELMRIELPDKILILAKETCDVIKYVLKQSTLKSAIREGYIKEYSIIKIGYLLENSRPVSEKGDSSYRKRFYNSFKVGLSKKLAGAPKQINPTRILLSGVFYRMYLQESTGKDVLFHEYYEVKKANIRTIVSLGLVKKDACKEYEIWKESFCF